MTLQSYPLPFEFDSAVVVPAHLAWRGAWLSLGDLHSPLAFARTHQLALPESIQNASLKRQREFVAGRWLAATLLAEFGLPWHTLAIGQNRAPLWPLGFSGSISHSKDKVAVVVGLGGYIGVDVEPLLSLSRANKLAPLITRESELALLKQRTSLETAVTMLFCAKEAAYKALLSPFVPHLDFHQLTLVDASEQCLTLRYSDERQTTRTVNCAFSIDNDTVFTFVRCQ
uniref:4'-phosphopantetheinyl transferase family protein n=1 Tax=Thaumasiovibrio occultus TaxID=1891184 RepID=UPI000B34E175|nr:4'-phosphopantetheinyl transferase superfamily protein [Thaumasiovibrio occultus]